MKNPKWEIKKSTDNKFYFVLKAENGEIILTSETYESKQGAFTGINSVKHNANTLNVEDQT